MPPCHVLGPYYAYCDWPCTLRAFQGRPVLTPRMLLGLLPCAVVLLRLQVVGTRYAHMAATYHGAKGTGAAH